MDEQKSPTPPNPAHQPGTGKGEEKPMKEGKESGRQDTGTMGAASGGRLRQAKRPAGKTTGETSTGVNPKDPVDPQSAHLPTP